MKKVLIISTSLRKNSNSEYLAKEFEKGAEDAGNEVEFISLSGKNIGFCHGCLVCQKTQKCVIKDDAIEIADKVKNAHILVFATPIYYYEMCGQMKTLLDRCNPLFPSDYTFRDVYLLATAADGNDSAMDGAVQGLQGWIDCFEKAKLAGVVRGVGINGAGSASQQTKLLKEIYILGKSV
ncbi:flavodoxin family protein [Caproiciproducens faecalis]|uniref:Flavodoxin family protein n=1 Tax=Caproiciproducens faecalis TaxID=2820301 RepID=A0ABS7DL35_9FIRM|nr:flavodoxin family protein [Caproiciproducens faecalis]MBW7572004.1 flavodoxin family protein [Caproiciproducens faecalis]